jgi:two-component system KDP operon response regulator KdpE
VARERILIVEDERAVARGPEYGLQAEGFETVWAATGHQALDLARSQDPQLTSSKVSIGVPTVPPKAVAWDWRSFRAWYRPTAGGSPLRAN